jgi:hypothetical protein
LMEFPFFLPVPEDVKRERVLEGWELLKLREAASPNVWRLKHHPTLVHQPKPTSDYGRQGNFNAVMAAHVPIQGTLQP